MLNVKNQDRYSTVALAYLQLQHNHYMLFLARLDWKAKVYHYIQSQHISNYLLSLSRCASDATASNTISLLSIPAAFNNCLCLHPMPLLNRQKLKYIFTKLLFYSNEDNFFV